MNQDALIAIIILILVIVSYATTVISLVNTTILALLSMVFLGILTPAEAFAGFGSSTTMMLVGMLIMGDAFFGCGLAQDVGDWFQKHFGHLSEQWLIVALFCFSAFLSAFFNGLVVVALLMPIIDSLVTSSDGKLTRKGTYYPVGIAASCGGSLSIVGSASMISAVGLLESSEYAYKTAFFEPAILALPGVLTAVLFYATVGKRLQDKLFDFSDIPVDTEFQDTHKQENNRIKKGITLITLLACAGLFVSNKLNIGVVSLLGATVLMLTKCVDEVRIFKRINWNTIIVVGGSIGFAKGIEVSGAAQVISDGLLTLFRGFADSPFFMCALVMILASILSNFMSNAASVLVTVPIGLNFATHFGCSPAPFAICCAVGANLAISTPICTACITSTLVAGYRPKDFFRIGGGLNILGLLITAIVMRFVYF